MKSDKSGDSAANFTFPGDKSFRRRPIAAGIFLAPIGLRRARVGAGAPCRRGETKIAHRPGFANRPKSPAFCACRDAWGFYFRPVAALLSTVCCRPFAWERPGLRREPVFFFFVGGGNAFYHARKLRSSVSFAQIGSPSREAKRKWNGKEPQRAGKERKVEGRKARPGARGSEGALGMEKGEKRRAMQRIALFFGLNRHPSRLTLRLWPRLF